MPDIAPCGSEPLSEIDDSCGGMFVTSQCVYTPFGASGSSTRIAMLCVFAGTFDHDSGGVLPSPSHVKSAGIAPFSANAGDVTVSVVRDGAADAVRDASRTVEASDVRMLRDAAMFAPVHRLLRVASRRTPWIPSERRRE